MTLPALTAPFRAELYAISNWWLTHALDLDNGGFFGGIDNFNRINSTASKGIIQNSRILWYFSEAAHFTGSPEEKLAADRAYEYLCAHFIDKEYSGVFWELDYRGELINGRKQIYGQAFALYALSAYYKLTGLDQALQLATNLFDLIERFGHDNERGGYLEAFSREWTNIADLRLSTRDMNWPKTMNTHLHLLEAYTALYSVWTNDRVRSTLCRLIRYFQEYFIDDRFHLRSFFDLHWRDKSEGYAYGHDIECSWLLWQAVHRLGDPTLVTDLKPAVVGIAATCLRDGIGAHGEVMDGYDRKNGKLLTERVWWIQAEAMIGFLNAFEITGDAAYYDAFESVWRFVQRYQIDPEFGEWRWLSSLDSSSRFADHKAGFWKGPYHNGRAMLEVCKRLARLNVPT